MAMKATEVRKWLDALIENDKDVEVGVDEGGLCLRVVDDEEDKEYCEVGGLPEVDDR